MIRQRGWRAAIKKSKVIIPINLMKYSRISRRLVFLAIAFLTSFFLACATTPKQPLKIGMDVWPGYEPLYLARDLGYFDGASIQLIEYSAMTEFQRAFRNGAIDMTAETLETTLEYKAGDDGVRVWLLLDVSDGGDALVGQSNIKNMQDLEGGIVGLYPDPLAKLILTRALQSAGVSIDTIKQVTLEGSEQEEGFSQKEIDAIVTYEPTRSRLLDRGANLLFDSRQMPGEIIDVLVGRKDLQDKFANELKVLAEGWFKALKYIRENPDDAMQRMAERQGVSKEQFSQSLNGLSFMDLEKNQALLSGESSELYEGAKRLATFLKEQDLLKQEVNLSNLFDDRFVKAIKP